MVKKKHALKNWIEVNGLTTAEFAGRIGATRAMVYKYFSGTLPSKEYMAAIHKATRGAVGPADFYGLPKKGVRK